MLVKIGILTVLLLLICPTAICFSGRISSVNKSGEVTGVLVEVQAGEEIYNLEVASQRTAKKSDIIGVVFQPLKFDVGHLASMQKVLTFLKGEDKSCSTLTVEEANATLDAAIAFIS